MEANRRTLIVVPTCERPRGVSYLGNTLRMLDEAGAVDLTRMVFVDGLDPPACSWPMLTFPSRTGVRGLMWHAFAWAFSKGFERLIFCEDDIEICRNAITYIDQLLIPDDLAFIDFHNMNRVPRSSPEDGIYPCPPAPYHGNQCMLFPRRTVEWLHNQPDWRHINPDAYPQGADVTLGILVERSPWPLYGIHFPCLVNHIGEVSVAHSGEKLRLGRVATNFPGVEFDALMIDPA